MGSQFQSQQTNGWTQALGSPSTGIGFSFIYSFDLAIHSKKLLLEKHNKAQDNENKLTVFISTSPYMKNNFNFHNYVLLKEISVVSI
jgi:hypothetical protein